jgi:hypothetical protein
VEMRKRKRETEIKSVEEKGKERKLRFNFTAPDRM